MKALLSKICQEDQLQHNMVSDIKSKVKVLNAENKAYFISRHIKAWKDITSDQWVNGTITGAKIEIEDLTKVTIG